MNQAEDLASVERLYATLETSALLALLPLIDTLSERVRQEIERIGGPITSISEAQQHAALFESVTAGLTGSTAEARARLAHVRGRGGSRRCSSSDGS